jgi:hypothetical protein
MQQTLMRRPAPDMPAPAAEDWRSAEDAARAAEHERLRDWLETQMRVAGWWLERVGTGQADAELAEAINGHRRAVLRLMALI